MLSKHKSEGADQSDGTIKQQHYFFPSRETASNRQIPNWLKVEKELKTKLITRDDVCWTLGNEEYELKRPLKFIGGVDISFSKEKPQNAAVTLVILAFPSLELVYEGTKEAIITVPYISSFLGFREAEPIVKLVEELKLAKPLLIPDVIVVDGAGICHPRGFGSACHIGVISGIPTVGVAKTWLTVDGVNQRAIKHLQHTYLKKGGDVCYIEGKTRGTIGALLLPTNGTTRPIFISIGHRLSLPTCVGVIQRCCRYRCCEPIRQADLRSRRWLRDTAVTCNNCNHIGYLSPTPV